MSSFRFQKVFVLLLYLKRGGGILFPTHNSICKKGGPVVVLVDEYDKPMLDNLGNLDVANEMRLVLRSFYRVLKSCDEYLRFVMLTGISKFSKTGVFSAMNNLQDISMDWRYGDIVGYTQTELEENFTGWIDGAAAYRDISAGCEALLKKILWTSV